MVEQDSNGNQKTMFNSTCNYCGYSFFKWPWKILPKNIHYYKRRMYLICGRCGKLTIEEFTHG